MLMERNNTTSLLFLFAFCIKIIYNIIADRYVLYNRVTEFAFKCYGKNTGHDENFITKIFWERSITTSLLFFTLKLEEHE